MRHFNFNNSTKNAISRLSFAFSIIACILFAGTVWGQAKVTVGSDISATGSMVLEVSGVDNASVSATPVERTSPNGLQLYCAYDIDITKDGREWQPEPEQPAMVSMEGTNFADGQMLDIYHEGANGLEFVATVASENGKITFPAHSFSVYIVAEAENYNRLKVVLHQADGNEVTIWVKKLDLGDTDVFNRIVYNPGKGTPADGVKCMGWIAKANYTGDDVPHSLDYAQVRDSIARRVDAGVTDGEVLDFYTMLFKTRSVTYLDHNDVVILSDQLLFRVNEDITNVDYTVNAPYTTDDSHKFEGWKINPAHNTSGINIVGYDADANNYPNLTRITITGDVVFDVHVIEGNWLVFDENGKGGTYNAPMFVLRNQNTVCPSMATAAEMKRKGYDFGGWYTNSECSDGNRFEFGGTIDSRTVIYAKWIPHTTAPYTVIMWTQNLNRDGFEVADSYVKENGTVGQNIPYTFEDNRDEDYVTGVGTGGHYTGFCLYDSCRNKQVTITPEGDAVLNLYYYRITYNFKFYLYRNATTTQTVYEYTETTDQDDNPEKYGFVNGSYTRIYWYNRDGAFYTRKNGGGSRYDGTVYTRTETTVYTEVPGSYDYANNSATGSDLNGLVSWHSNQTQHPGVTTDSGFEIQSETVDGRTYYYFVMQAYYGEDISRKWPTYDKITGANGREAVSFVMMVGTKLKPNPIADGSGTVKGIITVMNENILGATNNSNGNYVVVRFPDRYYNWRYHIWFETIDGETYANIKEYNGRTYYEHAEVVSRSSGTDSDDQNPPVYTGFDFVDRRNQGWNSTSQWTTSNPTLYHINFVYNREQFPISYFDGNYVDGNGNMIQNNGSNLIRESAEIGQGVTIADNLRNYAPDCPEGNGYIFEGWYVDKGCVEPYRWDKMTVGGIIVYAKWRQIQYRVFLHPNVPASDETLDWGTNNQAMNFRRSFGDKISVPKGIRDEYEQVGWYTDDACTQVFNSDLVLNESTVTAHYDKTTEFTDPMDKYGNGATWNSDSMENETTVRNPERFWITKKFDLYAKWRAKLKGANGITVVYDGNGGRPATYTAEFLYLDGASVITAPACESPDLDQEFSHWVLQHYNGSTFVDIPGSCIYPGATFVADWRDAQTEVLRWYNPANNETYTGDFNHSKPEDPNTSDEFTECEATYTLMLRAEYIAKEEETPEYTYIKWFRNDGTDAIVHIDGESTTSPTLGINVAVEPQVPTREGYNFKGWYRSNVAGAAIADCDPNFLHYNSSDNAFYRESSHTNVANYVAADNYEPMQYLYAIWEPIVDFAFAPICPGAPIELPLTTTYGKDLSADGWTWTASAGTVAGQSYTASSEAEVTLTFTPASSTCAQATDFVITPKTPNVPNASSYDFIWRGGTASHLTDWNTTSNWFVYNGNYSIATAMPTSDSKVFIGPADCITSNWPSQTAEASAKDITIADGASLTVPTGKTLKIYGNLDNIGTLSSATDGTVEFCGTSARREDQTISHDITLGNVVFYNQGGDIVPSGNVTINGAATFKDGVVKHDVTFGNNASVADAISMTYNSFVEGKVTKSGHAQGFTFPTGQNSVLGKIEATSDAENVSVQYFHNPRGFTESEMPRWWNINDMCSNNRPQLDHVSNVEYWDVATTLGIEAVLTVSAADGSAHFNSNTLTHEADDIYGAFWNGSCWENIGGGSQSVYGNSYGTISVAVKIPQTRTVYDKIVTLGSKDHNTVLPIELTSFSATCDGRSSYVMWTTATEKNNDYFSLERSDDAINFVEIARIAGAGNSIEPLSYSCTDYGVYGGDNYYRLVQVDYDGTRTASEIIVTNCVETSEEEPEVIAYPNPFNSDLTVELENFGDRPASIEVYDLLGRLVYVERAEAPQNNYQTILHLGDLSKSTYTVRVSTADFVINRKVVKD
ncbi:MAG: InlB B-repeat-containing protein [Bacteroidales bacterium]|nr:InlB B-repeat-containing protein [Bacteroidales bacterium]